MDKIDFVKLETWALNKYGQNNHPHFLVPAKKLYVKLFDKLRYNRLAPEYVAAGLLAGILNYYPKMNLKEELKEFNLPKETFTALEFLHELKNKANKEHFNNIKNIIMENQRIPESEAVTLAEYEYYTRTYVYKVTLNKVARIVKLFENLILIDEVRNPQYKVRFATQEKNYSTHLKKLIQSVKIIGGHNMNRANRLNVTKFLEEANVETVDKSLYIPTKPNN